MIRRGASTALRKQDERGVFCFVKNGERNSVKFFLLELYHFTMLYFKESGPCFTTKLCVKQVEPSF